MAARKRAADFRRREAERRSSTANLEMLRNCPDRLRALVARFREIVKAAHGAQRTDMSKALAADLRTKADVIDRLAKLTSRHAGAKPKKKRS